eukprot:749835-Pelagomonas_calceolata.AAC.3
MYARMRTHTPDPSGPPLPHAAPPAAPCAPLCSSPSALVHHPPAALAAVALAAAALAAAAVAVVAAAAAAAAAAVAAVAAPAAPAAPVAVVAAERGSQISHERRMGRLLQLVLPQWGTGAGVPRRGQAELSAEAVTRAAAAAALCSYTQTRTSKVPTDH